MPQTSPLGLLPEARLWTRSTPRPHGQENAKGATSKYPPAEPGALGCEPLKAAVRGR
jgi:hypothetical protein